MWQKLNWWLWFNVSFLTLSFHIFSKHTDLFSHLTLLSGYLKVVFYLHFGSFYCTSLLCEALWIAFTTSPCLSLLCLAFGNLLWTWMCWSEGLRLSGECFSNNQAAWCNYGVKHDRDFHCIAGSWSTGQRHGEEFTEHCCSVYKQCIATRLWCWSYNKTQLCVSCDV